MDVRADYTRALPSRPPSHCGPQRAVAVKTRVREEGPARSARLSGVTKLLRQAAAVISATGLEIVQNKSLEKSPGQSGVPAIGHARGRCEREALHWRPKRQRRF